MKKLTFKVDGQYIIRTDHEKPVAKCRHLYRAEFEFTGEIWAGAKTALFVNGENAKSQILDEKNACEIPWEFFDTDKGTIGFVSVFCGDLTTANSASVYITKSGYVESDASVPPTPDVYQQLIETANETKEIAQSVRDDADAGKFRGEQGPMGPTGARGEKGERGETGPQGPIGQTGPQGAKGEKGDTGEQGPKGETGPQGEVGKTGESAYQIAVKLGFKGTEQEWIESLKYDHSEEFANLAEEVRNTANSIVADREQIQKNKIDIENLGHNKADAIVSSASGEKIVLTDSDNEAFKGLNVYGKSTQVTTKGDQILKDTWVRHGGQLHENVKADKNGYIEFIRESKINLEFSLTFSDISQVIPQMNDEDVVYFRINKIKSKDFFNYQCVFKKANNEDTSKISLNGAIVRATYRELKEGVRVQFYFYNNTQSVTASVGDTFQFIISKNPKCEYEPYTGGKPSPSIEYPQEITSSGGNGDISVNVLGWNLLPFPYKLFLEERSSDGITFTPLEDGGIKINGTSTNAGYLNLDKFPYDENMIYTLWNKDGTEYKQTGQSLFFTHDANNNLVFINVPRAGLTYNNLVVYPMLSLDAPHKHFESYIEPQKLTIPTPNGLPGVPTDTGENYTDASGQRWITDEINLAREKHIQKIQNKVFNGSVEESWVLQSINEYGIANFQIPLTGARKDKTSQYIINRFQKQYEIIAKTKNEGAYVNQNPLLFIRINKERADTVEKFKEWLNKNPIKILYELETPIEHDLTPEEVAAYKVLHTNYPTTIVTNDENAGMEVSYVADTKNYITEYTKPLQEQITALQNALVNLKISGGGYNGLTVDNSSDLPVKNLRLFGKSTQLRTPGTQLLNPNKYVAEVFGIKSVIENDGSISIKGITTKTGNFRLTSPLNIDITTEMFLGMEVESNVPFDINHYNNDYTINAQFSVTQNGNYNHKYASLPTIDNGIFINLGKQYLNSQIDINIKMYIGKLQEYEPYTGGKPSPSIEYPQEITNACDKGNIEVNITGRNLLDDRDKTLNETKPQLFKAGTYYVKRFFKPNADKSINSKLMLWFNDRWNVVEGDVQLDDGNIINVGSMGWLGEEQKIILKKDYMIKMYTEDLRKENTEVSISIGDYLKEYEPYVDGQILTVPTPNGLPGIPVTSVGNYEDSNGKQWATDEIDLGCGKYIQRINRITFDGSTDEKWKISVQPNDLPYAYICLELNSKGQYDTNILCDRSISNHWHNKVVCFINEYKYFSFYRNDIPKSVFENTDNFKAWLVENPLELVYQIAEPIERYLTKEVIAAFKKMHTYSQATVISTDEDVNLELECIADTKSYVDTKIAEISTAIVQKGI